MHILLLALYLHPPTLTLPEIPPPLSDLSRFPSPAVCDYQLAFLTARREWLDNLHDIHRQPCYQPWFDAATDDIEARRAPWLALHRARAGREDDEWDWPGRADYAREQLAELRRLLGPREFEAGQLPGLIGPVFWRRAD